MFEIIKTHGDVRRARNAALGHALGQHGLIDDQFADQIDQSVYPVQIHTNGRLLRCSPMGRIRRHTGSRSDCRRRIGRCRDGRDWRWSRRGQDLSHNRRCRCRLNIGLGLLNQGHDVKGLIDARLTHHWEATGQLICRNGQVAVAIDKLKDLLNVRLAAIRGQDNRPAQIGVLRFQLGQAGKLGAVDRDLNIPKTLQFPQQQAGFIGLGVKGVFGAQLHRPATQCRALGLKVDDPRRQGRKAEIIAKPVIIRHGQGGKFQAGHIVKIFADDQSERYGTV